MECDVFISPGHIEIGLDRVERDFLGQLLETLFVQFDSVHVEAYEKFVEFFRGSAFHSVEKLKDGKVCFLCAQHTLGQLGAPREAVREIQCLWNHDAGNAGGPVGWGRGFENKAQSKLASRK